MAGMSCKQLSFIDSAMYIYAHQDQCTSYQQRSNEPLQYHLRTFDSSCRSTCFVAYQGMYTIVV